MLNVRLPIVASVCLLAGQLAHANVEVTFWESAPRPIHLTNTSQCALNDLKRYARYRTRGRPYF